MSKVIICANQKGGVAKTTTTINVGIGLARMGKKVLIIDNDPQGSLTEALGYQQPDEIDTTLSNIMEWVLNEDDFDLAAGILHHKEGVDLMPANIELAGVETSLIGIMSSETVLKDYIEMIGDRYDYIVIDCSPNLGQLTLNALVAADEIIIPVQPAYLPIKGLQQLLKTISRVKRKMNPKLHIMGILLTMVDYRTNYAMPMSIHFNPFSYIRNESDIMSIAGILMKATTPQDEAGGGNDQFFEQSAEVLLTSLIYILHDYYPKEMRNWKEFVNLLNATTVYTKTDGSIDNRPGGILEIAKKAQLKWKKNHESDFPGYVAIEKYYNGAAETTSSIVASLDAHCRYMKLQCVINLLSEDEIHIADSFGYSRPSDNSSTGKRILFIVTSEDKRYYDWIPSMVYSLFFDELYHLTAIDPKLHETLPHHLTYLMDEFANVTLPDSFVEKLSTMRSRNMSAVIIVQNLIQLKRKFPKFDMDKDLIGNCSIIDILGAPDMDSCEYLSKHFGTQTIHKASDSDAKDYKGQSSRSEDVMQKSLLSAEDIFAMKKDGECAIVVKGTDPLYETKCRMEATSFVKLLCRKHNPYDPKKTRRKRAECKAENGSFFMTGDMARVQAEKIRKEGKPILRLTENDVENLILEGRMNEPVTTLKMTEAMQKKLKENYERYLDENSDEAIDFEIYRDKTDNSKKAHEKYVLRAECVQNLLQEGYTKAQIKFLYELIMADYGAERIKAMFPLGCNIEEIKNFVKIL